METVVAQGHSLDPAAFRAALMQWGRAHFRPFPWRFATDPYCILVAEIMLHRTQARQVQPIYERFIQLYPDVPALARASRSDLHDILFSLGLRWRIDLIFDLAQILMERYSGQIPRQKANLLSLPGVSEYIAGAVRCFAWNEREGVIDTNTVRVAGRLFGLTIKPSSRRNRQFRDILAALVDPDQPRQYTYHLLDLAALICTPAQPDCAACPLAFCCITGRIRLAPPPVSS